ncbi:nuclear receptor-binding factor 2-like isoform X1 [Bacillus rossius redtenbacheri]|uniref:nuclear receptor-binding factor 2-like isoform X1 n=1 Tax=Bacillus rossius redtenbacheri TaxID=93214 RepID=UPI002FDED022
MDSSALNVAHQQHRRAEAHVQFRRFDEAVVCHRRAAEKIGEAMKATKVPRSLESLQLQQEYHLRQEEIVRLKKAQFEMYKMAVESHRLKMAHTLNKQEQVFVEPRDDASNLQIAIYRTMEEADSLLDLLVERRGADSDTDSECEQLEAGGMEAAVAGATKRPKDDRTVIEELRTLNHQLRALVFQLVTQLDACAAETGALRDRVRALEAESARGAGLHVVTDSVGGNSSPFAFSPCSELSPEATDPRPRRELPALAPLEMPSFDFSAIARRE